MGRNRNVRLPDSMEEDVERYMAENKVKFTDLVILGIANILQRDQSLSPEKPKIEPCKDMTKDEKSLLDANSEAVLEPGPVKPAIIRTTQDIQPVIQAIKAMPMRSYFKPYTKETQLHNKGKERNKFTS